MSIQKLAEALGIKKAYPEALNLYYPIPEERRSELCSREMIVELQEKLGAFVSLFYHAVGNRGNANTCGAG